MGFGASGPDMWAAVSRRRPTGGPIEGRSTPSSILLGRLLKMRSLVVGTATLERAKTGRVYREVSNTAERPPHTSGIPGNMLTYGRGSTLP